MVTQTRISSKTRTTCLPDRICLHGSGQVLGMCGDTQSNDTMLITTPYRLTLHWIFNFQVEITHSIFSVCTMKPSLLIVLFLQNVIKHIINEKWVYLSYNIPSAKRQSPDGSCSVSLPTQPHLAEFSKMQITFILRMVFFYYLIQCQEWTIYSVSFDPNSLCFSLRPVTPFLLRLTAAVSFPSVTVYGSPRGTFVFSKK